MPVVHVLPKWQKMNNWCPVCWIIRYFAVLSMTNISNR